MDKPNNLTSSYDDVVDDGSVRLGRRLPPAGDNFNPYLSAADEADYDDDAYGKIGSVFERRVVLHHYRPNASNDTSAVPLKATSTNTLTVPTQSKAATAPARRPRTDSF